MPKFRKKPVVIEAFQMTKKHRWDNHDWPNWLHRAWNMKPQETGCFYCKNGGEQLFIRTLEGEHQVSFDDFIIQGVHGELYPCKPDIFRKTYEPIEASPI